jgi:hypothetical protein
MIRRGRWLLRLGTDSKMKPQSPAPPTPYNPKAFPCGIPVTVDHRELNVLCLIVKEWMLANPLDYRIEVMRGVVEKAKRDMETGLMYYRERRGI